MRISIHLCVGEKVILRFHRWLPTLELHFPPPNQVTLFSGDYKVTDKLVIAGPRYSARIITSKLSLHHFGVTNLSLKRYWFIITYQLATWLSLIYYFESLSCHFWLRNSSIVSINLSLTRCSLIVSTLITYHFHVIQRVICTSFTQHFHIVCTLTYHSDIIFGTLFIYYLVVIVINCRIVIENCDGNFRKQQQFSLMMNCLISFRLVLAPFRCKIYCWTLLSFT